MDKPLKINDEHIPFSDGKYTAIIQGELVVMRSGVSVYSFKPTKTIDLNLQYVFVRGGNVYTE